MIDMMCVSCGLQLLLVFLIATAFNPSRCNAAQINSITASSRNNHNINIRQIQNAQRGAVHRELSGKSVKYTHKKNGKKSSSANMSSTKSSKNRKSDKKSKSSKKSSPTSQQDESCFSSSSQAAEMGVWVMNSLTSSLAETGCNVNESNEVFEKYFREDIKLQDEDATVLAQGLDQVKKYYDDSGLLASACSGSVSWTAQEAITNPRILNEFVLGANENSDAINAEERGRYVAIELFSGQENMMKTSEEFASLPKRCQRPQIYAIVFQPTFEQIS